MKIYAETDRLVLREILHSDEHAIFELDSNPEVHRYLGKQPILRLAEAKNAISFIRQQYLDNGIGRWAVIEKQSGKFIGWAGLKLIKEPINGRNNYLDLGYRFIQKYWGNGYATESALASLRYAFEEMHSESVFAITEVQNQVSKRVLEKAGLQLKETFELDKAAHFWFEIWKEDYLAQENTERQLNL